MNDDRVGGSTSSPRADTGSTTPARPELVEGRKPKSGWLNVLVDYAPLLVFFLTYRYFAPDGEDIAGEIFAVIRGTGANALARKKMTSGP